MTDSKGFPMTWVLTLIIYWNGADAQPQIAYLSNQSGNFDVFIMQADGTNQRQLTYNPGWDWAPTWNAGLQAILYNSTDTSNQFSIKAMTLQGDSVHLPNQGWDEFILAPSGRLALYTLADHGHRYVGLIDTVTKTNQLLITHPSYNGRPIWSPDSKRFSFISDREGNNELYCFDLESQKTKRLTHSEKSEKYASWLPDAQNIAYTYHYSEVKDQEHNDIFIVSIGTGKITQVTNDAKFYQEIAVSPDGQLIAFHAKRNGQDQIYSIRIDGSGEKQLTSAQAYHGEPNWVGYD